MTPFNWNCPHCGRAVTISAERHSVNYHPLDLGESSRRFVLTSNLVVCPNPECEMVTVKVAWSTGVWLDAGTDLVPSKKINEWTLVPDTRVTNFPGYIPKPLRDDHREACLIRVLSPKASATLSRRCLQGMIRDFWGVRCGRLVDEIAAIQDQVDPITWEAIDAVRKIGNIGAHMERDIDTIVEVDPDEADLLIQLIETLFREWYIVRHDRRARMTELAALAASKRVTPTA